MRTLSFFAVPALVAALAGCAVGPDHRPAPTPAPAGWASWHGGAPSLIGAERGRPPIDMPLDGWKAFNDPVLDRLQARALAANFDLQTAALRFAQSRARRTTAAAQQGPQLGASAAASRQRQSESGNATRLVDAIAPSNRDELIGVLSQPHNLYQAGFDASWEIDLWGRVRRAVEAADADVEASAALLRQVQLSVQAEVARDYFELRAVQRQLRLAQEDVTVGAESLELVQARADGGLTTDLDATRQRAQLADLRARVPVLQQQEAQALNQITLLAGEAPGTLNAELADAGDAQAAALPDLALGLPSELAQRRPDIVAAEAQLHAATARIGVAVGDLYPRIVLGANFGFESVSSARFGDWGSRQWSIGPSISLPVFDQGQRRATVTLRELQQQEAAVAYQQTVLRAWHEVDAALTAYTAEQQRQAQLAVKERSGRDALVLAQARYRNGLTDFGVELDAQRTLLQARREYADSTAQLAVRLVAIYKALGA